MIHPPHPAGPISSGRYLPHSLFGKYADHEWAKRAVNWWRPAGRTDLTLNVSRFAESSQAEDHSITISLGDPGDLDAPKAELSESELRDLLNAVGCLWARRI